MQVLKDAWKGKIQPTQAELLADAVAKHNIKVSQALVKTRQTRVECICSQRPFHCSGDRCSLCTAKTTLWFLRRTAVAWLRCCQMPGWCGCSRQGTCPTRSAPKTFCASFGSF